MSFQEPDGAVLSSAAELLYRQVSPSFLDVDGFLTAQIFRPTKKDDGLLSLDRSTLVSSPEAALVNYSANGRNSRGVLGVSVGECNEVGLKCHEDPQPDNTAHVVANFRGLSRGQCEKKSKLLLAFAEARGGYLYQVPGA